MSQTHPFDPASQSDVDSTPGDASTSSSNPPPSLQSVQQEILEARAEAEARAEERRLGGASGVAGKAVISREVGEELLAKLHRAVGASHNGSTSEPDRTRTGYDDVRELLFESLIDFETQPRISRATVLDRGSLWHRIKATVRGIRSADASGSKTAGPSGAEGAAGEAAETARASSDDDERAGVQETSSLFLVGPAVGSWIGDLGVRQRERFLEKLGPDRTVGQDGVFLVGGVRGSGKSHLLRALRERYLEAWQKADPDTDAPIWISVDLGQEFEPGQFLRNILNALSERVVRRHHRGSPSRRLRVHAHRVASWCRNNMAWALATILVVVALLVPALLDGVDYVRPYFDLPFHLAWLLTTHPVLLLGEAWFYPLLAMLWLLVAILAVASCSTEMRIARFIRWLPFGFLVVVAGVLAWLGNAIASPLIGVVAVGMTLLLWRLLWTVRVDSKSGPPSWRLLVEYVDDLSTRIRHDKNATPVAIPYVGAILSQLLPSRHYEPIAELSVPFLEEQVRELVARAAAAHGRVAFLVDDVDALPKGHYHAVLRAFRPLAKLDGVVVVIAVPQHFFPAYLQTQPNDIHSTAEDFFFLGPNELYDMTAAGFARPKAELKLSDLLDRYLPRVWWNEAWGQDADDKWMGRGGEKDLLCEELKVVWGRDDYPTRGQRLDEQTTHWKIVNHFGGSYREFRRLTRELLRARGTTLHDYWEKRSEPPPTEADFDGLKKSLFLRAQLLDCDGEKREMDGAAPDAGAGAANGNAAIPPGGPYGGAQ